VEPLGRSSLEWKGWSWDTLTFAFHLHTTHFLCEFIKIVLFVFPFFVSFIFDSASPKPHILSKIYVYQFYPKASFLDSFSSMQLCFLQNLSLSLSLSLNKEQSALIISDCYCFVMHFHHFLIISISLWISCLKYAC